MEIRAIHRIVRDVSGYWSGVQYAPLKPIKHAVTVSSAVFASIDAIKGHKYINGKEHWNAEYALIAEAINSNLKKVRVIEKNWSTLSILEFGGDKWIARVLERGGRDPRCSANCSLVDVADLIVNAYGENLVLSFGDEKSPWKFTVKPDASMGSVLKSEQSERLTERINKFTQRQHHRGLILYGDAGTGKSCIAQAVAKGRGGTTIRVSAEQSHRSIEYISNVCNYFLPTTLIVDDFDRGSNMNQVMSHFEKLKEVVPLIIITINDSKKLDPALMRPGRFDEVVEVKKLEGPGIDALYGEFPEELRPRIECLPIAYINELKIRADVLGIELALQEIEELEQRSKELSYEN